jgi:DNA-binding response OmpR family regulator
MTSIRVLMVEDNPADVGLISEMLSEVRGATFDVTHAERLATALRRLDEEQPDAVLLDLSLPDSDGLETFLSVRKHAPASLPIVVLTGLNDLGTAAKAVEEGAQAYLV